MAWTTTFVVEHYRPGLTAVDVRRWTTRLAGVDAPVQVVRTALLPDDGCLLCDVRASSLEAVRQACELADVPVDRISRAMICSRPRAGTNVPATLRGPS
jgi:hypothetical protein